MTDTPDTPAAEAATRNRRRSYKGFVVSTTMAKTISVATTKLVKHPHYGKYVRRTSKLLAHDEEGKAKDGDYVEIMESRPLSKRKHFRLVRILRAAQE